MKHENENSQSDLFIAFLVFAFVVYPFILLISARRRREEEQGVNTQPKSYAYDST